MRVLIYGIAFWISVNLQAEITLDGTLGTQIALEGPNYQIGVELGQQEGNHLFHSFEQFNLNSSESATFSGPSTISNIISRVTGGSPSSINGTLLICFVGSSDGSLGQVHIQLA